MKDVIPVLAVAYAGMCVGTFISINELNTKLFSKMCISILAPIPVFAVLVWATNSVAREKFHTFSDYCGYPLLLAMSLAMYPDALAILLLHKTTKTTRIASYKYRVPMIRKAVATNYIAA